MVYAHRQELVQLDRVVFSVVITLVILSCIAVSIRLWVRVKITKSPGWDDAVMIATLVCYTLLMDELKLTDAGTIQCLLLHHPRDDFPGRARKTVQRTKPSYKYHRMFPLLTLHL